MLQVRLSHVIETVVEQELYGKGRENEALHFALDISLAHYSGAKTISVRKGLHLLYYARPQSTTIHVFSAITDRPFGSIREIGNWNHEVSHDSCWRSDNTAFSTVYFDMAKIINERLVSDGKKEIPPVKMTEHNFFEGRRLFNWVYVNMVKDPECEIKYKQRISVV